jgi:PPM family protein phosphatase
MAVGAYAVASDTGRKRRRNEDNYVVEPPLFAVADGIGGAQAGEVASKLAATVLAEGESGGAGGLERIDALIQEANRRIYDRAVSDPALSGMGTTVTVALVEGMTVAMGHVGDSRAYLVRGEQMEQLTEDHSLVNELVKSGRLSAAEVHLHPQRSVITRAVGTDPGVDVDRFTVEAEDGDVFLLCSDGLSDMVADEEILELLDRHRDDLDRAVKALAVAANRHGGEDNITAVAFRITAQPAGEDTLRMPAVSASAFEPDARTREYLEDPAFRAMVDPPAKSRSSRLVLTALVLVAAATALLVWGLLR